MHEFLNRRNYLWWIGVCAIPPLIKAIGTLLLRLAPDSLNDEEMFLNLTGIAYIAYTLSLVVAQYLALRRVAPWLTLPRWFGMMILAFCLYVSLCLIAAIFMQSPFFNWDMWIVALAEKMAGHKLPQGAPNDTNWLQLPQLFIANVIAFILLPAWTLGKHSELRWKAFFCAALLGNGAAIIVAVPLLITTAGLVDGTCAWCEPGWNEVMINAINACAAGAIEAAVGCFVLSLMVRKTDPDINLQEPLQLLKWTGLAVLLWAGIGVSAEIYGNAEPPEHPALSAPVATPLAPAGSPRPGL